MSRPMKFREVVSAFRDREDILEEIFSSTKWQGDYWQIYKNYQRLGREVLDAPVPIELSRAIAARYPVQFFFYPEKNLLREATIDHFPNDQRVKITALEVHDRFGGSIIEEVFEKGSARVDKGTF